ncbi:MAG: ABC transporter ATP-binding protein [Rhodocyclaceae bacterium]|nr:ABC transporter ATP-binding protein [Rhodocyclaceae bacterium]
MSTPLLEVRDLAVDLHLGGRALRVVAGVDFEIRRGETFALLGESGCGKSMTALALMRLLPDVGAVAGGAVRLDGEDLMARPEALMRELRGRRMAMIFQEPMLSLNPVMTIGAQIGEVLTGHLGLSAKAAAARTVELLTAVGIADPLRRLDEYPFQLSGGMKQRVMIAMALAGEPELLIADEPTTALDVTIQAQVLDLLKRLQAERGMSLLLITHDLGVVANMAHHVAVMYAGQVVESGSCEQVLQRPRHPYTRLLLTALPEVTGPNQRLATIPGQVPPLDGGVAGCRFAPRCAWVRDDCRSLAPGWDGTLRQGVRCPHADGLAALPEAPRGAGASGQAAGSDVPLLRAVDVSVHFPIRAGLLRHEVGAVKAVDGVSLSIPAGRTLALVGESGCGKTTLGKAIVRLNTLTGGEISFAGGDWSGLRGEALRSRRNQVQIVFQDPYASLDPRMRVADILTEGMAALGVGRNASDRLARVDRLLDQVGLPAAARWRFPHEFSGGQRQRIAIARALAVEPRLIVCDEPTSALDVSVQAQILNLLKDLQDELGVAYLLISHNLSVVEYLAHEVAVMYLGRIVEQGEAKRVLKRPQHPYTQALLSAIPRVDATRQTQRVVLGGELPSPANPPEGCHFNPRCAFADRVCREAYPPPVQADEREVRCHHVVQAGGAYVAAPLRPRLPGEL